MVNQNNNARFNTTSLTKTNHVIIKLLSSNYPENQVINIIILDYFLSWTFIKYLFTVAFLEQCATLWFPWWYMMVVLLLYFWTKINYNNNKAIKLFYLKWHSHKMWDKRFMFHIRVDYWRHWYKYLNNVILWPINQLTRRKLSVWLIHHF